MPIPAVPIPAARPPCKFLHVMNTLFFIMSKKVKRKRNDDRIVTYVRVAPLEHAQITRIAKKRGRPHTIASVAAEMISRGLKVEAAVTPAEVQEF